MCGPVLQGTSVSPATSFAASSSIRSTVSPAVRQGASEIGRCRACRGRAPCPRVGHHAVERIEARAPSIRRNRPLQTLIAALAEPARHPRQRHRQVGQQPPFRRHAEDVQAVADLHFLEVAEIGVELLAAPCPRRRSWSMPASLVEADVAHEVEDLLAEQPQPARIDAGRLVIFVDQRLEVLQRPIGFGARQRRRQMVDDDGAVRRLAWVPSPGSLTMNG